MTAKCEVTSSPRVASAPFRPLSTPFDHSLLDDTHSSTGCNGIIRGNVEKQEMSVPLGNWDPLRPPAGDFM